MKSVTRIADQMAKNSTGKRRMDAVQARDLLEDLRRYIHEEEGLDFYELLAPFDGPFMSVVDTKGNEWLCFRRYPKLPVRKGAK